MACCRDARRFSRPEFAVPGHVRLLGTSWACYFASSLGWGGAMIRLVQTRAPAGECAGDQEPGHHEAAHQRTPVGFVFGGLVSGLFWGVLGVTAWLVI
jgi:hypothetical protein